MALDQNPITTADFDFVRNLAKTTAAIVFEDDKRYLIESRLSTLAQDEGFASLRALVNALRDADESSRLHTRTIDALTTNETLFFRDRHPFDAMVQTVIPEMIHARRFERTLKIWSAASSTGQEAYSLAMLLRDKFPELLTWRITIIGTDICEDVLAQAKTGIYGQHEINRGLPAPMLVKYFQSTGEERKWTVRDNIRSMVEFRKLNLIQSWTGLPVFDIVFIRNVLIYFDVPAKRDILERIAAKQIAPDGYLSLGSAETTVTVTPVFRPVTLGRAVLYRPVQEA